MKKNIRDVDKFWVSFFEEQKNIQGEVKFVRFRKGYKIVILKP